MDDWIFQLAAAGKSKKTASCAIKSEIHNSVDGGLPGGISASCRALDLKKFSKIFVSQVKIIGIDEIYISRTTAQKFITVIRDLESGAVLYFGEGKGTAALDGALKIRK